MTQTAARDGRDPQDAQPDQGPATFRGWDPETVMANAVSHSTPTKCQARTRLYRNGVLELEGFPVADISEYLQDESVVLWLDLRAPDRADLAVLSSEFGLHPLAIEDAVHEHQRPKLDRYRSHLFLAAYAASWTPRAGSSAPANWLPSSPGGP